MYMSKYHISLVHTLRQNQENTGVSTHSLISYCNSNYELFTQCDCYVTVMIVVCLLVVCVSRFPLKTQVY